MVKEFRLLRADEIDVRISAANSYGVGLLLYKDARCDQNILDETVGAMNWQRHHSRDNANCTVSIWDPDKAQWIEKEDTGTESYTEKEKGLASDSFKRACFNWGIGRELYTAPKMFVKSKDLKTLEEKNGKYTCRDYFRVTSIEYDGRKIAKVEILNEKTDETLVFGEPVAVKEERETVAKKKIGARKANALEKMIADAGGNPEAVKIAFKVSTLADLTEEQHARLVRKIAERNGNDGKD